jgi:hypothetical protein
MYKLKERLIMWIVWKLPRILVYWCAIRLMTFNGGCPDRSCSDALKGWGNV